MLLQVPLLTSRIPHLKCHFPLDAPEHIFYHTSCGLVWERPWISKSGSLHCHAGAKRSISVWGKYDHSRDCAPAILWAVHEPPLRRYRATTLRQAQGKLRLAPTRSTNPNQLKSLYLCLSIVYTQNRGQEKSIIQSPETDTHHHPGGGKSPSPPLRKGGKWFSPPLRNRLNLAHT